MTPGVYRARPRAAAGRRPTAGQTAPPRPLSARDRFDAAPAATSVRLAAHRGEAAPANVVPEVADTRDSTARDETRFCLSTIGLVAIAAPLPRARGGAAMRPLWLRKRRPPRTPRHARNGRAALVRSGAARTLASPGRCGSRRSPASALGPRPLRARADRWGGTRYSRQARVRWRLDCEAARLVFPPDRQTDCAVISAATSSGASR